MAPPSVVWPNPKCLLYLRRDSRCSRESPSSAFHQKWQAAHFSGKFLPVFKFASTLRSRLCSDAQRVASLRKIVIVVGHRAPSLCPCGCQSWNNFSLIKSSSLSSSTLRISRRLLFSGVFQELWHSTIRACSHEKLPLHLLQSILRADLMSASEGWPRSCVILRDRSRFLITAILISKFSPSGTF